MSERRPHELEDVSYAGCHWFRCVRCGAFRLASIGWDEDCPKFEPPAPEACDPPGFGESPVSVGEAFDRALSESVFDRLDRKHRR